MSIEVLNGQIKMCHKCRLAETRIHALCGEGNLQARLMLIAQAPGENEDREGQMFIGPSGEVLRDLLRTIDIDLPDLYMTNLVKCMLPGYRKPKADEIEICSRYLDREIELINPRILVSLGYYATRYLLGRYAIALPPRAELHQVYGEVLPAGDRKLLPVRHPAAVLYNSSIKEEMVRNYSKMRLLLTNLLKKGQQAQWPDKKRESKR